MSKSDQEYYRRRAEQERIIADQCVDGGVAHIQLQLANAYDAKLSGQPDGSTPHGAS
jgi:hypothetical protein